MKPWDAIRYRPIVSCDVSPDGRFAAVSVPDHDPKSDARPLSTWVADLDGGATFVRLATRPPADGLFGPSFAPDSSRLALFAARGASQELYLFRRGEDGFAPEGVPRVPILPSTLKWRGSPGELACTGEDDLGWRRVYVWTDLGGEPVPLTPPGEHAGDYAFRPDGARLAWLTLPEPDDPRSERLPIEIALGDGSGRTSLRVPGRPIGYLAWAPEGPWLAYLARRAGHRLSGALLYVVDPEKPLSDPERARCLTPDLEGQITGYDWLPGGEALVVAVVLGTSGRLLRVGLDGTAAPIGPARTYLSGPHADRSRGRLLHLHQDVDEPQRLCLLEPGESRARGLTRFNRRLSPAPLLPGETVGWTAVDGTPLEGILVRPAAPAPAPLLVWVHGGPAENIARTFSPYFQVFAAAG